MIDLLHNKIQKFSSKTTVIKDLNASRFKVLNPTTLVVSIKSWYARDYNEMLIVKLDTETSEYRVLHSRLFEGRDDCYFIPNSTYFILNGPDNKRRWLYKFDEYVLALTVLITRV